MNLFFRKYGEGKPVIILHGFLGFSDSWVSVGKKLAENNFCVYIPDQRNHGCSPHIEEFNYTILSQDLNEFIIQHTIEKPIIIGHSMGGKVAMNYALNFKNNIEKLIVIDIGIKKYFDNHNRIIDILSIVKPNNFFSRKEIDKYLEEMFEDFLFRQLIQKNIKRNKNNSFEWKFNFESIKKNFKFIQDEIISENIFTKPTLFIRGGLSDYINLNDFQEIKKLFPNSSLYTIDGASHMVHADKPKEFFEVISNFIS